MLLNLEYTIYTVHLTLSVDVGTLFFYSVLLYLYCLILTFIVFYYLKEILSQLFI